MTFAGGSGNPSLTVKFFRFFPFLAVICGLTASISAPSASAQAPSDGLVLYYPFTGGSVLDYSGSGNNGTSYNVTSTADRFGNANSALLFDGTDSYIGFPDVVFGPDAQGFTYSFWMRADAANSSFVFSKGSNGQTAAYFSSTGAISTQVKFVDGQWLVASATAGSYTLGTWVQVVVVYQQATTIQLWIDGQFIASTTPPDEDLYAGILSASTIGTSIQNGGPYQSFQGAIDDVRVYNRALSSQEVAQLYDAESTAPGAPTIVQNPATDVTPFSALLSGTAFPAGADATVYFEYGLDQTYGSRTDVIALGNATDAVPINLTLSGLQPGVTYHFQMVISSSGSTIYGGDGTFQTPAVTPSIEQNPASNFSSSSALLSGTVNPGGAAATVWFEYGTTNVYGMSTPPAQIGNGTDPIYVDAPLNGLLSGTTYHYQLVVSNTGGTYYGGDGTFSTSGSPQFFEPPSQGLVLYYPFTDGSVQDASGSGNDGMAYNVTTTADRFGNANHALLFNGTDSYVSFPDGVFGPAAAGFTFSFWMRADAALSSFPFDKGSSNGEAAAFLSDSLAISTQIKFQDGSWAAASGSAGEYSIGTWVQVVAVYAQAQTIQLWVNGQLVASATPPNENLFAGGNSSAIGTSIQNGAPYESFQGAIDDVRIYNRALSANEVAQLYSAEAPSLPNFATSVVAAKGDPATSFPGHNYLSPSLPSINSNGYTAFGATIATGSQSRSATGFGIWADDSSGARQLVAFNGEPAPGANGAAFAELSAPVYNNNEAVAFLALLNDKAHDTGIWTNVSGGLARLVGTGDQAAGCPKGVTYSQFTAISLADSGQIVFEASLQGKSSKPAVTHENDIGIWAAESNGTTVLIARTGQQISVENVSKTIKSLTIFPLYSYVYGQSRSVDGVAGNIIYQATFSDGTNAILKANPQ